ncbi:MAG: TonB-dependent receptor [Gemmatimonadota bacterium]
MSARLTSLARHGALLGATLFAMGAAALPAAAQTGQIVGQVRDAASQRPLEAVQVFIQGTSTGALTNAAGRFLLLNVPAGEQEVTAEIVGYRVVRRTVVVEAGEAVTLDFNLEQTAIQLDQIVVTGAGVATEKRKLGNTIATIDASSLQDAPVTDFSQLIAGREPGVVALPASGVTGEGAQIRIRGSASLSQLNEPIIFVDGIRMDNGAVPIGAGGQGNTSRLDDIPPESIERIEVLKGAAAATLYGTEASNGVIQIFTKKGRAGAPNFTLQGDWTAVSVPTGRIDPLADFAGRVCGTPGCTGEGDLEDLNATQARIADRFGLNVGAFDPFEQDLIPDMLGTGFGQVYSGSVSGGSDVFQYFVSGRFSHENGPYDAPSNFDPVEGVEPAQDINQRLNTTANFTIIPNDKFRIGLSTLYAQTDQETPDNSNNIYGVFSSSMMMQLRLAEEGNYYGAPAFGTTREFMYQVNESNTSRFAGSLNLGFTPLDNFRLDGTVGLDFASDDVVNFQPYGWNVDGVSTNNPDGARTVTERRNRELTADVKGSWIEDFELGGLGIENTFLFGGQAFISQQETAGGSGQDFPGPGLEVVSAVDNQSAFETFLRVAQVGAYIQDQIGFADWIFLTLGGRWDANSAFGSELSTVFYPKVSFSVVPSDGLDWRNDVISDFRIRGAVGQSGLQPGAFDAFTTYQPQPGPGGPGIAPDNLGNDALSPEISTEWEIGTELGFFNGRFSFDGTYWNRTVSDALVSRQFAPSGGFTANQLVNIGELKGEGIELNLQGAVVQKENFGLNVFVNGAYLSEEVTDLGGAPPLKTGGTYSRYRNYIVEGFAPGAFFGAEVARDLDIPLNILQPQNGVCVAPTREQALEWFSQPRSPPTWASLRRTGRARSGSTCRS